MFCGASPGRGPAYRRAGRVGRGGLGASAASALVYGGGRVGLMGAVADAALAAGGEVIGVIPRRLVDRELAHPGLTELHVVESLHERKAKMAELADGFIALPGGLGTLEELAEVASWAQLELHDKPIGLLSPGGYWEPFLGVARPRRRRGVHRAATPGADRHRRRSRRAARSVRGLAAAAGPVGRPPPDALIGLSIGRTGRGHGRSSAGLTRVRSRWHRRLRSLTGVVDQHLQPSPQPG